MKDSKTDASNPFFEIPAGRSKQANVPVNPQLVSNSTSPEDGQRSYENMERQAFLARERAEIKIPQQPTDVKPVRIMNENFLAAQRNFGAGSLKASNTIPGVEVSDMVDARTGRSIVRITREKQPPQPSNEVRIVPRREDRIAGHDLENSFPSQATLKRETSQATAKLIVGDKVESNAANLDASLAMENQPEAQSTATESQSSSRDSDFCLQGKCPVALAMEGKWIDGDARWGIVHRDRTYLFSSEENYRRFQEKPDYYSPVLAAYDPVAFHDSGNFVDGLEENGVFMEKDENQQIVLFSSAANREKFQTNPQLYMRSVRKAIYAASRVDAPANASDTLIR